MNEVHVCDVVLQAKSWSVDRRTLAKVHRRLGDLAAYAPKLTGLLLGELTWSLEPLGKDLVLRLNLVPIRQGWLFDPLEVGPARPATLEEEALQIFEELSAARVRVTRLAQALAPNQDNQIHERAARDPLAEVLVRQSRRQWHISRGRDVVQVEFPDMPAFDVDDTPRQIKGTLALVGMGWLELAGATGGSDISSKDRLRIACTEGAPAFTAVAGIGAAVSLEVRLCRCRLTRRVAGGILEAVVHRP